jgi:hemin uptake protein HemP
MPRSRPVHEPAPAPIRASVQPTAPPPGGHPAAPFARRWRSTELFGPEQEIEIEHGQAVYRLRLTSLGKLILTK